MVKYINDMDRSSVGSTTSNDCAHTTMYEHENYRCDQTGVGEMYHIKYVFLSISAEIKISKLRISKKERVCSDHTEMVSSVSKMCTNRVTSLCHQKIPVKM